MWIYYIPIYIGYYKRDRGWLPVAAGDHAGGPSEATDYSFLFYFSHS